MQEKDNIKPRVLWHRWFSDLFKVSLEPLGIEVKTDYPVMSNLPEADIILIRRYHKKWTKQQRERLPDGIRNTESSHIIVELKYTESLNDDTYCQTGGYYKFYKVSNKLKSGDLDTFIISSKTPSKKFINEFGYEQTSLPGVLKSKLPVIRKFTLIVLNDLADTPHNIFFKMFSSKKRQLKGVAKKIKQLIIENYFPEDLAQYFYQFFEVLYTNEEKKMSIFELSPKEKQEFLLIFEDLILEKTSVEKRIKSLKLEDRLKGLKPEELEMLKLYIKTMSKKTGI